MRYIRLCGTPTIKFAHIFDAPSYNHVLPRAENQIEITYLSAGKTFHEQGWERIESESFHVGCNLFQEPANISANGYHEHRTVCFSVPFEVLEESEEGAFCLPHNLPLSAREKIHDLIDGVGGNVDALGVGVCLSQRLVCRQPILQWQNGEDCV